MLRRDQRRSSIRQLLQPYVKKGTSMSIRACSVVAAIAFGMVGGRVALAVDSCGAGCPKSPKAARSVSMPPAPLGVFPQPLLAVGLLKGKAKTMLNVEATIATGPVAPGAAVRPAMIVDANGVPMEPAAGLPLIEDCGSSSHFSCTLTGTFWLDLDQNPSLIGVPITVTLTGGGFGGVGAS